MVLPSGLLLLAVGAKGKARLPLAASLGGCVACALLFSNVLIPALGIPDETASGIYSVCFQQSARVLRDHGDTVTPEEYAEIDRVLDAEKLPELYETNISDPVKFTFRYSGQGAAVEKEALKRYAQTWKKMAAEYPLSYAEAFFGGSTGYYAFIPKMEGPSYNNQAGNRLMFETYTLGTIPATSTPARSASCPRCEHCWPPMPGAGGGFRCSVCCTAAQRIRGCWWAWVCIWSAGGSGGGWPRSCRRC